MRFTLPVLTRLTPLTTLTLAAAAHAQSVSTTDMSAQLTELKAANDALALKVARLEEGANGAQWLTEKRATEIRAIVTDVLADSAMRTSLQSAGATAGWNKDQGGFFIASPSGDFKLNIRGQLQTRWALDYRNTSGITTTNQGATNTVPKADEWGFENRRTKIAFTGFVVDPSWTYEMQLVMNRATGTLTAGSQALAANNVVGSVENLWMEKDFGNGVSVKIGQFKSPFLREELVSSTAQLAADRTLVNAVFSTAFSQGVQLELGGDAGDKTRATFFYGDGQRANATSVPTNTAANFAAPAGGFAGAYTTNFAGNLTNWSFAGRVEYLGAGAWKQFRDFTSMRGEEFGWLVGVGGMGQSLRPANEGDQSASSTKSMWGATADVSMDFGGANLFAYGVYRLVNLNGEVATRDGDESDAMHQWGAVVQGGVFVTNEMELFARYEVGNTDTDQFRTVEPGVTLELDSIATVGFNYYFGGHKDVKWTSDLGYAFNPVCDFSANGANYLVDLSGNTGDGFTNDGQWVVRTQLQLLF